jgi:hypothetical protein
MAKTTTFRKQHQHQDGKGTRPKEAAQDQHQVAQSSLSKMSLHPIWHLLDLISKVVVRAGGTDPMPGLCGSNQPYSTMLIIP